MPPLVRKASAVAFEEFATIMRRTSRVSKLSRHGGVQAPALPATAAFRRHGFRLLFFLVQEWAFRIRCKTVAGDEFGHGAAPPLADVQVVT